MNAFTPTKPRVTGTTYRGRDGAIIDLPGHRGAGIFISRAHLTDTIDALCQIENTQEHE